MSDPVVWPQPPYGFCACGRELHYSVRGHQDRILALIREQGENIKVTVGLRSWLVPRHYIALHGLKAQELPHMGFPEIGPEEIVLR